MSVMWHPCVAKVVVRCTDSGAIEEVRDVPLRVGRDLTAPMSWIDAMEEPVAIHANVDAVVADRAPVWMASCLRRRIHESGGVFGETARC